jgi:hypothetical protein
VQNLTAGGGALWQAELMDLAEWEGLMRKKMWREWAVMAGAVVVAGLVAVPGTVLSQGVEDSRTLMIEGQAGQAPVLRLRGKSYVELEALARLSHGSLSFNGNQVTLTLPGSGTNTATTIAGDKSEFSKEFLRAGIEEMTMVREWRIALTNAVQSGIPIGDDWMAIYRGPALKNLRLASVAASTDADRNAYQLFSNEFENMKKLSDRFVAAHTAQNYLPPDSLKSDPLNEQILSCARSLAEMAASGQFVDDGSCH